MIPTHDEFAVLSVNFTIGTLYNESVQEVRFTPDFMVAFRDAPNAEISTMTRS